jgi:predicted protein tyrosine phosphatase
MQLGTAFIDKEMLAEADFVLATEQKRFKFIKQNLGTAYTGKMQVLGIQDVYTFGDGQLKSILLDKTKKYLE